MSQEDAATPEEEPKAKQTEETKVSNTDANVNASVTPQDGKTFDAEYVKQLRSEAAANRKARQEAEAKIEEYENANKSELEKLTGKVAKAEKEKAEAEARLLRFEVAAEKEVPADYLDLLVGTTREDLEAKADKIAELAKKRDETPDFDGGAREPAPEPKTADEAHNAFMLELLGGKQT